jgi:nitrite reductase (NADH) small subunit
MSGDAKHWVRVTQCENIPLREGKAVVLDGKEIAIFNLGDKFLAVENRCPHRGGPLSDGIVSGAKVICPLHAWAFDLASGNVVNHPESQACLATFAVKVEAGELSVEMPVDIQERVSEPANCDHRDRPVRWIQRKAPPLSSAPASAS